MRGKIVSRTVQAGQYGLTKAPRSGFVRSVNVLNVTSDNLASLSDSQVGLLPRVIAAGWFACAACVPVIFFFLMSDRGEGASTEDLLTGVVLFAVLPISIAALFGFIIGS